MKKILSILLSVALPIFAVDEKPKPEVYEAMTPANIQFELYPRFQFTDQSDVAGLTYFDFRYVSPPKDVAERWIAAAAKKVDRTYAEELHDCDDLAWEMLVFLRREALHAHPNLKHAVLAGMAGVRITEPIPELGIEFTGDHALVLIRVHGGTWWLIEPSNGKGTKLDEELFDGRLQLLGVWF